jgi:hypothetical protein
MFETLFGSKEQKDEMINLRPAQTGLSETKISSEITYADPLAILVVISTLSKTGLEVLTEAKDLAGARRVTRSFADCPTKYQPLPGWPKDTAWINHHQKIMTVIDVRPFGKRSYKLYPFTADDIVAMTKKPQQRLIDLIEGNTAPSENNEAVLALVAQWEEEDKELARANRRPHRPELKAQV